MANSYFQRTLILSNSETSITAVTSSTFYLQSLANSFQVLIGANATVLLRATLDEANWVTIDTVTASGIVNITEPYTAISAVVNSTSGATTAVFATAVQSPSN